MDIKLIDVAARAGVSPATVSRVLNDSSRVTPATKDKVRHAIAELGYYPNAAAKNLRSQRSMTIGILVPDINSAYYAEIIKGIENMAYARKYKIIICDVDNNEEKEREYLSLLMDRTVDAFILMSPSLPNEEIIQIAEKGYTLAVIGRNMEHDKIPCIFTDNAKFAREVMAHLAAQGHREIAFIGGFADSTDSLERLKSYREGLEEHRLPFRPGYVESGDFNEAGGYESAKRLLAMKPQPTAIFAANDEMALGVYRACAEFAVRIPEEVAVVGVDNNRIGKYLTPALSTVSQPKYTMGAVIVEKLIDQMNANEFQDKRVFKVDSQLLVRGSSIYERGPAV